MATWTKLIVWSMSLVALSACSSHSAATPTTNPASTETSLSLSLHSGPYSFLVPDGWVPAPTTNLGGPASFGSFFDPASTARIDYEINGGSVPTAYNEDRTPNPRGALDLARCRITGFAIVSATRAEFSCAANTLNWPSPITTTSSPSPSTDADEINGALVVGPYPDGTKILLVTLPVAQHRVATAILDSFVGQ